MERHFHHFFRAIRLIGNFGDYQSRIWKYGFAIGFFMVSSERLGLINRILPSSLAEIFDPLLLWGGLIIIFVSTFLCVNSFFQAWNAAGVAIADKFQAMRRAFPSTLSFATMHGDVENVPTGGAIELFRYSFTTAVTKVAAAETTDIVIINTGNYDLSQIPEAIRQDPTQDPDNRTKYSLVDWKPPLQDRPKMNLIVKEIKWNDYIPYVRAIETNDELRHKYISLKPKDSKVPNSLCMHFILAFADGAILAMRRSHHLAYEREQISISFEEQLSDSDFSTDPDQVVDNWVKRSLCEEIFPLKKTYETHPASAWERAKKYIDHYKMLALVLEERFGSYSLVAFCQMSIVSNEYLPLYRQLKQEFQDDRDLEGDLILIDRENIVRLVRNGSCTGVAASGSRPIAVQNVHSTSLYRTLEYAAMSGLV